MKIALSLFLLLVVAAAIGPRFASYSPDVSVLSDSLQRPSSAHALGTDENGRDILSRLLYGARISLSLSFAVVVLASIIGTIIGFLAAYRGGWLDRFFLMIGDIFQAFPGMLLAIGIAAFLPPSFFNVLLLLVITGWVGYARVVRAQVLGLREKEYVQAALSLGVSVPRQFLRYFVPNLAGPLLVQIVFGMAGVMLTESTLSFLGLGLPLTYPTWGRMLDGGSQLLLVAPHVSFFPGLAIFISILTFNLLGDALREKFYT